MVPILIHKGDCTVFADCKRFLTFNIETDLDLTGWQARFILGWVEKTIDDISTHSFEIILGAQDTKQLRLGKQYGTIILTDSNGNIKTVTNTIPFEVTTAVVENEYQEIDLTIPESSGVDIKLKVGASYVTSINGMTGDVNLDIPSIEGLVTEKQLDDGLETKQDKGDYALREEIPSLEGYVKNTDYANGITGGVVKMVGVKDSGLSVNSSGFLKIENASEQNIAEKANVRKPITPQSIDLTVKTGITTNTLELTEEEKANAKQWLGYADQTDIMQAIASIPQFKLSIVEELPLAGEKMTLYLVPKEGTNNDVYDEYIWIEQTTSFEHLGTTAVDLTDYVKNTDYAGSGKTGVIALSNVYGTLMVDSFGTIGATNRTLTQYNAGQVYMFISKGTLENVKNDLVKRAVTENDIELTDDEKTSARTWLGAVGKAEFATDGNVGVVRGNGATGLYCDANGDLVCSIASLEAYEKKPGKYVIGKGTLNSVLAQYSKTVLTTEADYNALETKDANTLYLIEE